MKQAVSTEYRLSRLADSSSVHTDELFHHERVTKGPCSLIMHPCATEGTSMKYSHRDDGSRTVLDMMRWTSSRLRVSSMPCNEFCAFPSLPGQLIPRLNIRMMPLRWHYGLFGATIMFSRSAPPCKGTPKQ